MDDRGDYNSSPCTLYRLANERGTGEKEKNE